MPKSLEKRRSFIIKNDSIIEKRACRAHSLIDFCSFDAINTCKQKAHEYLKLQGIRSHPVSRVFLMSAELVWICANSFFMQIIL